jgi:hypothetical protein
MKDEVRICVTNEYLPVFSLTRALSRSTGQLDVRTASHAESGDRSGRSSSAYSGVSLPERRDSRKADFDGRISFIISAEIVTTFERPVKLNLVKNFCNVPGKCAIMILGNNALIVEHGSLKEHVREALPNQHQ